MKPKRIRYCSVPLDGEICKVKDCPIKNLNFPWTPPDTVCPRPQKHHEEDL